MKTYDLFLFGKFFKRIECKNREEACRKARHYFYNRIVDINPKPRITDSVIVSDNYNECFYHNAFSCSSLKNKFLDEKSIERIINGSNGILRAATKEETSMCRYGNQFKKNKRNRILPTLEWGPIYNYKSNKVTTYFYCVRDSKKHQSLMIKLSAQSFPQALEDAIRRELYKKDAAKYAKEKWYGVCRKYKEVRGIGIKNFKKVRPELENLLYQRFDNPVMRDAKISEDFSAKTIFFDYKTKSFKYNPIWVSNRINNLWGEILDEIRKSI